jgi:hypothetical protein
MIAGKFNLPAYTDFSSTSLPSDWVTNITSTSSVEDKRRNLGILATFWWMVWKERNKRIFKDRESSASVVASLTTDLVRLVCCARSDQEL